MPTEAMVCFQCQGEGFLWGFSQVDDDRPDNIVCYECQGVGFVEVAVLPEPEPEQRVLEFR